MADLCDLTTTTGAGRLAPMEGRKMTKDDAVKQASWRAKFEKIPCTVIRSIRRKGRFQTEIYTEAIPKDEIVEIIQPQDVMAGFWRRA